MSMAMVEVIKMNEIASTVEMTFCAEINKTNNSTLSDFRLSTFIP